MDFSSTENEVVDVENWSGDGKRIFSHQSLVMKSIGNIQELCSHELSEGVNETNYDPTQRTTKIVYKEDTQKAFFNSIRACAAIMNCDFDDEATQVVSDLFETIGNKKQELTGLQWKWWGELSKKQQVESKLTIHQNFLYKDLPFYKEFVEFKIELCMQILEELNNLTGRLDFYAEEEVEA